MIHGSGEWQSVFPLPCIIVNTQSKKWGEVWEKPTVGQRHLPCPLPYSSGAACLCLCFWGSLLIGGFANGVVRIYDAKTGLRKVEIAAHSRCITALDVATEAGLVRWCVCVGGGGGG